MQHKSSVFKIALPNCWLVAVNGQKLVDEVQRMPGDKMSFQEALGDVSIYFFSSESKKLSAQVIGFRHIFGVEIITDPFHIGVLRDKVTRNLAPIFGDVHNEIETSFQELIPAKGDGMLNTFAFFIRACAHRCA